MVGSRTVTAIAGLVISVGISIVVWWQFDTLLLFLLVPFVPFLFRRGDDRPPIRECPQCGFRSRDPEHTYCPRDGTRLE